MFSCFLMAGPVLPFSEFFLQIMETFDLRFLQLYPQAVLVISIFAHLCEGFVGVMQSVELFGHYYMSRLENAEWISGSVTWRLRDRIRYPAGNFKSKWDEWHQVWLYVHINEGDCHKCCLEPKAAAKPEAFWSDKVPLSEHLEICMARINTLCSRGLTANMIASDFLCRRLALLP